MASCDFTAADGTALATYDSHWQLSSGSALGNITINSNTLRAAAWVTSVIYYDSPDDADTSQLDVIGGVATPIAVFASVRVSSTHRGYDACLGSLSGGNWTSLFIQKDGTWLASKSGSWSASSNHTIKINATGTSTVTIKTWVDGVAMSDTTDSSSPLGTAYPGMRIYLNAGSAANVVDNWTDGYSALAGLFIPLVMGIYGQQ